VFLNKGDLTLLIPLSFKGEGEVVFEGACPFNLALINELYSKGWHTVVEYCGRHT